MSGGWPFTILSKVGANEYKLELLGDMAISPTFNVRDLSPYMQDDFEFRDLRVNHLKGGEDDVDQNSDHGLQSEHGKSLFTDHPTSVL